jgi:hypothetical protein
MRRGIGLAGSGEDREEAGFFFKRYESQTNAKISKQKYLKFPQ